MCDTFCFTRNCGLIFRLTIKLKIHSRLHQALRLVIFKKVYRTSIMAHTTTQQLSCDPQVHSFGYPNHSAHWVCVVTRNKVDWIQLQLREAISSEVPSVFILSHIHVTVQANLLRFMRIAPTLQDSSISLVPNHSLNRLDNEFQVLGPVHRTFIYLVSNIGNL